MTISKWEAAALALAGLFLAFTAGWFLRGNTAAAPIRVETQRTLEDTVIALPAPTVIPEQEKVNINTADAEALMTLPGIGEKRAADIIADRETNGPYRFPEDITRVKGIGEETLAELIDDITVEDAK
ncbi:ComEA family DNA-binding protein [Vermiculatibacterium agrestimuris]|uniref:ComEA family DNA-binding protein n=1 Tax=Vermiculatibacterium agrestimuris TaxID=2941519 RepID=UPI00203ABB67|nr:ComEA family DNA-binding protein [Vermiculatibacterium agrestimuris]